VARQNLLAHWFLAHLILDPEDGSDTYLRNVGSYTRAYPCFPGLVLSSVQQSIPHSAMMFYGDCMEMCEDLSPNFGDKRTGCCITTAHVSHFFYQDLSLNHFSLFPRLKIKLKGRHFNTIEVIKAESEAVPKTSQKMVASRPKDGF
jgi:hypothetical protein